MTRRNQDQWMEVQELRQEVQKLKELLNNERANFIREQTWRSELCQELENTKQELTRQKKLKEMFINREKETRRDLQRLQKYSDPETLSTTKMATEVRNTIKRKKKKLLQVDYEELQVAHLISQEKFPAQLQAEKEKNKALQEELEQLKTSFHEVTTRHQVDALTARQQIENLQRELEKEVKAHADGVSKELLLQRNMRADQGALQQKMAQEIRLLQQNATEKEMSLQRELEQLRTSFHEVTRRHEVDVLAARQQIDNLQRDLEKEAKAYVDSVSNTLLLEQTMRAEQEALQQRMAQEFSLLQQHTAEREMSLQRQVDELRTQYSTQLAINQELSMKLNQTPQAIFTGQQSQEKPVEEPVYEHQTGTNNPSVSYHLPMEIDVCEEILHDNTATPSAWKTTRHFLGLRKPHKWKKPRAPTSSTDN